MRYKIQAHYINFLENRLLQKNPHQRPSKPYQLDSMVSVQRLLDQPFSQEHLLVMAKISVHLE